MTTDAFLDQTPNRLRRFACMMYEAVLLFGVVFLAGYLLDTLTQSKNARPAKRGCLWPSAPTSCCAGAAVGRRCP
jgi:hypothetical protein